MELSHHERKTSLFSPPEYAIDIARKILKNICGDKKPVILTVRVRRKTLVGCEA